MGDVLSRLGLGRTGEEGGLGTLLRGNSAFRATGASINTTHTLALLAEIYLRHNRIDEGLSVIEEAQKFAATWENCFGTRSCYD